MAGGLVGPLEGQSQSLLLQLRPKIYTKKNYVKTTKLQNIWERVDPIPLFTAIPVLKYISILFIILMVRVPLATFSRFVFHYMILIVIVIVIVII